MAGPIAIQEPKRPTECPCVKQQRPIAACGLLTVSASQIGSAAGLIVGAIFYLVSVLSAGGHPNIQTEDVTLRTQFWAILLLSALYYLVAEWVLEENDYHKLRDLPWARFEFWLRVGLGVMFGMAIPGLPEALRFGLGDLHASFFFVSIIYLGFLLWDVVVASCGATHLVKRVVGTDFGGLVLILICLWTHATYPNLAGILTLVAFGLPLIQLYIAIRQFGVERLYKRTLQR